MMAPCDPSVPFAIKSDRTVRRPDYLESMLGLQASRKFHPHFARILRFLIDGSANVSSSPEKMIKTPAQSATQLRKLPGSEQYEHQSENQGYFPTAEHKLLLEITTASLRIQTLPHCPPIHNPRSTLFTPTLLTFRRPSIIPRARGCSHSGPRPPAFRFLRNSPVGYRSASAARASRTFWVGT